MDEEEYEEYLDAIDAIDPLLELNFEDAPSGLYQQTRDEKGLRVPGCYVSQPLPVDY